LQATIEFPDPINKDDFVEKIMAIVEQFLLNHGNELPSPILVCAKSFSATGEEVSRVL
jgi:hypothetical protein